MPGQSPTRVTVRPCRGVEEFEACVRLQKHIWGYAEGESYPVRLFVNLAHIGGHVIGAFSSPADRAQDALGTFASRQTERQAPSEAQEQACQARPSQQFRRGAQEGLVGFVAAMPAWRGGKRYLHSLSLGVAAGHENLGLGKRLKLEQRKLSLAAGIRWIEWTFDPMRAKNAFFNIVRLGAIARRYEADYYGRVQSRLQQGLPSDRLVCEWWLRSARVRAAVEGAGAAGAPVVSGGRERVMGERKPAAEIAIPADFRSLAEQDPEKARKLQRSVRRKFEASLRRGLVVTGFERGERINRYLLEPFDEN